MRQTAATLKLSMRFSSGKEGSSSCRQPLLTLNLARAKTLKARVNSKRGSHHSPWPTTAKPRANLVRYLA